MNRQAPTTCVSGLILNRMLVEDHTSEPPVSSTIGQLLSAADGAARRIADRIIGESDDCPIVAICAEEGLLLLLCQLAVMRADCAFLLVDPTLPKDRMEYMLSDSKAALLLLESLPATEPIVPFMEVFEHSIVNACDHAEDALSELFAPQLSPRLMYVCYTSGSTGRPKGCEVTRGVGLEAFFSYLVSTQTVHPRGFPCESDELLED